MGYADIRHDLFALILGEQPVQVVLDIDLAPSRWTCSADGQPVIDIFPTHPSSGK
jgi:hypothetical protein